MLRVRNLLLAAALGAALCVTASAGIIHTDNKQEPAPTPTPVAQTTEGIIHTDEAEATAEETTGLTEITLTLLESVLALF
jgi:hypothetical protein